MLPLSILKCAAAAARSIARRSRHHIHRTGHAVRFATRRLPAVANAVAGPACRLVAVAGGLSAGVITPLAVYSPAATVVPAQSELRTFGPVTQGFWGDPAADAPRSNGGGGSGPL